MIEPAWLFGGVGLVCGIVGWLIRTELKMASSAQELAQHRREIGAIDVRHLAMQTELNQQSRAQVRIEEQLKSVLRGIEEIHQALRKRGGDDK